MDVVTGCHKFVVYQKAFTRAYRKADWLSPIRGICDLGMKSDYRSKTKSTRQPQGLYCFEVPKSSLGAEDMRRLSVFEHLHLRSTGRIWWDNFLRISEVKHK